MAAQVLTNGRYKAPLHRVLASGPEPRYSAAFFFSPAHEAEVAPLPSCIDEAHPALYRSAPRLQCMTRKPAASMQAGVGLGCLGM